MSEKKEQTSNKKKISLIIAVILVIAIVVGLAIWAGRKDPDQKPSGENETGVSETLANGESAVSEEFATLEAIEETTAQEESPWEDVTMIQETQSDNYMRDDKGNPVTDEKGEIVTEAYPGEAQGWSPLVPADELGTK